MRDRLISASIFLGTGAVLLVITPLRASLTAGAGLLGAVFMIVAVAVLAASDFRPAAFFAVWFGAIATVTAVLAPLDSSIVLELVAAIFFATLAIGLWFAAALGLRLFWLEGRAVSRR